MIAQGGNRQQAIVGWQGRSSGVEEQGGFRGRCAGRSVLVGKREKVRVGSGQLTIDRAAPSRWWAGGLVGSC